MAWGPFWDDGKILVRGQDLRPEKTTLEQMDLHQES